MFIKKQPLLITGFFLRAQKKPYVLLPRQCDLHELHVGDWSFTTDAHHDCFRQEVERAIEDKCQLFKAKSANITLVGRLDLDFLRVECCFDLNVFIASGARTNTFCGTTRVDRTSSIAACMLVSPL